jgi:hypothetical protein
VGIHGLDEQLTNDLGKPLFWSGNVLSSMDQRGELRPVLVPLKGDQRVGLEDGFKSRTRLAGLVAKLGQVFQVPGDMLFVPFDQDRLDTREVLVERGSPDTRLVGYLGHRHRTQPVPSDKGSGGFQDCIAYFPSVCGDGLVPEPWNLASIRDGEIRDTLYCA